jgi:hypothetical protein
MKLKFTIKTSFKYLYLILFLTNVYLIYSAYTFANDNIYKTIFPDENISKLENRKYSEDLDLNNFNKVIKNIKQKSNTGASMPSSANQTNDTPTSTVDNLQ